MTRSQSDQVLEMLQRRPEARGHPKPHFYHYTGEPGLQQQEFLERSSIESIKSDAEAREGHPAPRHSPG